MAINGYTSYTHTVVLLCAEIDKMQTRWFACQERRRYDEDGKQPTLNTVVSHRLVEDNLPHVVVIAIAIQQLGHVIAPK